MNDFPEMFSKEASIIFSILIWNEQHYIPQVSIYVLIYHNYKLIFSRASIIQVFDELERQSLNEVPIR